MFTRSFLIVLICCIMTSASTQADVQDESVVWKEDVVRIWNHGSVWRRESVEFTVADWKTKATPHMPRLILKIGKPIPCHKIKPRRLKRGITICETSDKVYAETVMFFYRHVFIAAKVMLGRTPITAANDQNSVSHEITHALTGMPDCYGCKPGQSAVKGWNPLPGPYDKHFAKKAYRKHDKR